MSKMLSRVILAVVLCGGLQSAALAEELEKPDMCFSMAASDFDWQTCHVMKKKFDKTLDIMRSYQKPDVKKKLRKMNKKEKADFFKANGDVERDWRFGLLGRVKTSCQDVEVDNGVFHIYRRRELSKLEEKEKELPYTHDVVKGEDLKETGMLASLVTGFTPTRAMVCVDWKSPLQGPAEAAFTSKIAEEFFKQKFMGFQLSVLQVRTKKGVNK